MSGHTPRPWRMVQEDGHWIVRGSNYDAVCRLYAGGNGDLIAAAPDLLHACKMVAEMAVGWMPLTPGDIAEVRAAIAKAEGR